MPIYIRHNNVWLKLKKLHTITPQRGKKRSSFHTTIAESVERVNYNGYRYKASIIVPFSKVMRFAIRAFIEIDKKGYNAVILITSINDDYRADIYAQSKRELTRVVHTLEKILEDLQKRRRRGEEEEEEEGDEEEVAEEE